MRVQSLILSHEHKSCWFESTQSSLPHSESRTCFLHYWISPGTIQLIILTKKGEIKIAEKDTATLINTVGSK